MHGSTILINLAGAVALLLWGTQMISASVLRGFGTPLRNWLGQHLGNRWMALLAGLGITGLLQSSTATSMMAASFTANGTLALAPALAVMLGASLGSTLVVQLLSFDTSLLAPLLILLGLLLFRLSAELRLSSVGQALIGTGLMLLALRLLGQALGQIEHSAVFAVMLQGLAGDALIALLLAALLTWVCHSSVAVVLLIASLALAALVPLETALALVLGANLGGALPALGGKRSAMARRLPLGNLLMRLLGCLLALPLLAPLSRLGLTLGTPGQAVVYFHMAFNLALALLVIGATGPLAALLLRLLPDEPQPADPGMPHYLDEAGLAVVNIGLANATREALRTADLLGQMLQGTARLLERADRNQAGQVQRLDQALDQLSAAIRAYLADLGQDGMSDADADRAQEILLFVINLEHAGDIITNSLLQLALRRASHGFSEFELSRIMPLHAALEESLRLAVSLFLAEDLVAARQLLARKELLRQLEASAGREQFRRQRDDRGLWIEAGDILPRLLRDYRRIHHHIAALAYPLLERNGATRADAEPGRAQMLGAARQVKPT